MHERKRLMFERSDAFVALPGGVGTLEELVEQMTWAQLGRHDKPILIADIDGFWTPLIALLDHMKTVVLAVRNITTDIEQNSGAVRDEEVAKKRAKLKSKVSATANNVITASKNYAAAGGLSPVSLLDAAASHLTAAVVDLVKTVKIKPTPHGDLNDDDNGTLTPLQSN
ncbi:MAG: hypothetical protein M1823_006589, partial [Watsoniomyces obsoletus]